MSKSGKLGVMGFSLVELVVVILLVGITSVVVIPRFLGAAAADNTAARDGIISIVRSAQQAALGRSDISVEIKSTSDYWELTALETGSPLRRFTIPNRAVVLETGAVTASASTCASAYDVAVANDFELQFDRLGNLASFTNNATTEVVSPSFNGVRLCVNDNDIYSVCVSPAGYAYAGNCDD